MTTQTGYFRINSGAIGLVNQSAAAANFHQPQVEPWRERLEREMLDRARPGPSGAEQAIEQRLLDQVSGKAPPAAQVSPQLGAVFQANRPQPSRKEVELEARLFEQVSASGGFQPER